MKKIILLLLFLFLLNISNLIAQEAWDFLNKKATEAGKSSVVATVAKTSVKAEYGTVKCSWLNFRSGPGTNHRRITCLRYGTKVRILGKEGDWYKVYVNGQVCYVHSHYIEKLADSESVTDNTTNNDNNSSSNSNNNTADNNSNETQQPGSTVIPNVPYHSQLSQENVVLVDNNPPPINFKGSWCGPTSLRMVAEHLGKTGDCKSTYDYAKVSNYNYGRFSERDSKKRVGTPIAGIAEGAKELGMENAKTVWSASKKSLLSQLEQGKPAIVLLSRGHYVVVTGYKNGRIMVNDPYSSGNGRKNWSWSYFYNRWNARGRAAVYF